MNTVPGMFDPNAYDLPSGGGQLKISDPNGYMVTITHAEIKPTKANDGTLLALTLTAQDGSTEGTHRLNIGNKSQKAVDIAIGELTTICFIAGVTQAFNFNQDCSILYGKPIRVVVGPGEGTYTEVKKFLMPDGSKPSRDAAPAQAAPAMQPAQPAMIAPAMQHAPVVAQPMQQAPVMQPQMMTPAAAALQQPQTVAPALQPGLQPAPVAQPVSQPQPGPAAPPWQTPGQ